MTTKPTEAHSATPAAEPLALKSNDVLGPTPLVERLRTRCGFSSTDGLRWYRSSQPDIDCREAADEIERLRGLLSRCLPSVDACCPTQTALLSPANDHDIPGLRRDVRRALGPNVL